MKMNESGKETHQNDEQYYEPSTEADGSEQHFDSYVTALGQWLR